MSLSGASNGGSSMRLAAGADDVAWQQNADDDNANALPEDGCLKLGDDEIGEDNNNVELRQRRRSKYVTRFRIDHEVQTSKLCSEVASEVFIPCCSCGDKEEANERPVSIVWYFVGSELLIFIIHISTVVFGVAKEALDWRHHESTEALHFAHSVVETVATFVVLVLQMLSTRMGYVKVRQAVQRLEHFDPENDAHLRTIRTWMWATVAAGFLLIAICVGCFLAFYGFVHLGWTVLSNQTCIITSLLLFGLFASRVITATVKINIDQHKVVIHEALMLLKDRCRDAGAGGDDVANSNSSSSSSSSKIAALSFINAVSNTRSLSRPSYINVTCSSQRHSTRSSAII